MQEALLMKSYEGGENFDASDSSSLRLRDSSRLRSRWRFCFMAPIWGAHLRALREREARRAWFGSGCGPGWARYVLEMW